MKKMIQQLSKLTFGVSFATLGMNWVMPSIAQAADITFKITWDGSFFFNTASAVGFITIDEDSLPNPGSLPVNFEVPEINVDNPTDPNFNENISPINAVVKELTITVSGAISGNGDYFLEDFGGIIWNTNGVQLDFTKELVGQSTVGLPWGSLVNTPADGTNYSTAYLKPLQYGGDFNVFDPPECVPTGVQPFVLATCSAQVGKTSLMRLTSFKAVPVPFPGAVFGVIAAGGLMAVSRKKKKSNSLKSVKE